MNIVISRTAIFLVLTLFTSTGYGKAIVTSRSYAKMNYAIVSCSTCNRIVETFEKWPTWDSLKPMLAKLVIANQTNQPWSIDIPPNKPAVQAWPIPAPGKPTLRVLHLTDLHADPEYVIGSEADCATHEFMNDYSVCCRNYTDDDNATMQLDYESTIKMPAGKWGSLASCDIPYRTLLATLDHIAQKAGKLDYIMLTGDLEPHAIWDYTKESTTTIIENINGLLDKYFPGIPIVQSLGNHEGVPMDAMAPRSIPEYETRGPQWLYSLLNKVWSKWLPASTSETIDYRTSYSFMLYKKLKIISLNSVYCSRFNFYLYVNDTDPDDTLKWLTSELLSAEQAGQKVHIISHFPTGDTDCLQAWSDNYYKLVNRFEGTIMAQFYGHTHFDHFYMYFDEFDSSKRPTGVAIVGPSVTTHSNVNPAYKIYTIDGDYDGSSFTVIDEDTYWANITRANEEDKVTYELEYNRKAAFNMSDLSPASFHDLLIRLTTDDALLDKYITYYRRNDAPLKTCDKACRKQYICEALAGKAWQDVCKNF